MPSSRKEINNIVKILTKQNWRVKEGKHIMLYPPNSKTIICVSKSPASGSTQKIRKQCRDAGAKGL